MGNSLSLGSGASSGGLGSCLLSEQEFMALKVGSQFDHRDYQGRFLLAQVLRKGQKSRTQIYIHYVGYDSKYDKWVDYKNVPFDFAKAGSVSQRAASGPLKHHGVRQTVAYCPNPKDSNCKWREAEIQDVDRQSGQVYVVYSDDSGMQRGRYVHLDNQFEIDEKKRLNNQNNNSNYNGGNGNYKRNKYGNNNNHNGSRGRNQHGHTHGRYNYNQNQNQYQTQRQAQVQRQDQMTVRTQLLLDDTHKQLQLTRNYLEAAAQAKCSKEELSMYNQKAVLGLTCFRMKVNGMRKNAKAEGISFDDAFKSSWMVIKQFEKEFRAQFGGNQFLMQRLEPCLNYMRAVLKGDVKVPPLPYANDGYEFNADVASSVISSVNHAQNHVLPDRMKEISANNDQYKAHQKELSQQYQAEQKDEEENGGAQKTKKIDYRHLIQDFNTNNIAFAESKAKQQQRFQQQQEAFRYQQPNLMDGDGHQCDHGMDTLRSQNQDEKPDVDMFSKH